MKPTNFIRERAGYYWVLAEYESRSSPGKFYEVRTSQRDGKTYCTCKGWVGALNKLRRIGSKADVMCCHIELFREQRPAETIAVMNFEDFVHVKRGIVLGDTIIINPNTATVRRK